MKPQNDDQTLDRVVERELDALESALAGEPVSPEHSDLAALASELRELRETPPERFAAELDSRAAAGFPGRRRHGLAAALAQRLRSWTPRGRLMPMLAGATTVIVVATAVVVATNQGGGESPSPTLSAPSSESQTLEKDAAPAQAAPAPAPARALGAGGLAGGESAPAPPAQFDSRAAPAARNRKVERSAELTLGTDPEHVQEVAGEALDVVGRYRGIVLNSSVRDGAEGDTGASFELLIPSRRLSGALTDLSAIAEVRSRSENTLDITAPFVSARERLRDARAEAEGLLKQLAEATTETERNSVKAQLKIVRGRIAAFRSQVQRLERRADFSHVSLQIVTGEQAAFPGSGDGNWTIGDAADDAGRVLTVAAGVALISLALLLPLALLGGTGWFARRAYLRRAREQALGSQA